MLITTNPIPPVAVAGERQEVVAGSPVQLDGSQSVGAPSSYQWALPSVPSGSAADVSAASSVTPKVFAADVAGYYVAQFIVANKELTSIPSTVLITATVPLLTANPGSVGFGNQVVGVTMRLAAGRDHECRHR